jgi:hypothetical protein
VLIPRERYPDAAVRKRELRPLHSPKAERVLRVPLNAGSRAWKMQHLAREAHVSLGQVANVKRLLLDREWAESAADGLRLRSPGDAVLPLLTGWASSCRAERNRAQQYDTMQTPPEIEAELCSNHAVALTALSGAVRLAPAVRYQRVTAYVEGDTAGAAGSVGLRRVTGGGNVVLLIPYDEGVFHGGRVVDGVRVISPVQLYLDLAGIKGRGEKAAQPILHDVIKPLWQ